MKRLLPTGSGRPSTSTPTAPLPTPRVRRLSTNSETSQNDSNYMLPTAVSFPQDELSNNKDINVLVLYQTPSDLPAIKNMIWDIPTQVLKTLNNNINKPNSEAPWDNIYDRGWDRNIKVSYSLLHHAKEGGQITLCREVQNADFLLLFARDMSHMLSNYYSHDKPPKIFTIMSWTSADPMTLKLNPSEPPSSPYVATLNNMMSMNNLIQGLIQAHHRIKNPTQQLNSPDPLPSSRLSTPVQRTLRLNERPERERTADRNTQVQQDYNITPIEVKNRVHNCCTIL